MANHSTFYVSSSLDWRLNPPPLSLATTLPTRWLKRPFILYSERPDREFRVWVSGSITQRCMEYHCMHERLANTTKCICFAWHTETYPDLSTIINMPLTIPQERPGAAEMKLKPLFLANYPEFKNEHMIKSRNCRFSWYWPCPGGRSSIWRS